MMKYEKVLQILANGKKFGAITFSKNTSRTKLQSINCKSGTQKLQNRYIRNTYRG